MLVRRIVLQDFGLFRGRHELVLAPNGRGRNQRPVVLIGGKNGSGKTTILDGLRLCLYGPLALGNRVSVREYEVYLSERIHRGDTPLFQPTTASVAVEFDYAQAGILSRYLIERIWEKNDKGVRTSLNVARDGKPLDSLDREHADEFLRDLIPPGVSQLFFFDGEKIQELAEGDEDHLALAEAVRGLIGLDHVERLRADLRIYAGRLQDLPSAAPLRDQLAALINEKDALDSRRLALVQQRDEHQSQADRICQEIAREERKLTQIGGAYVNRRDKLQLEKESLKATIGECETEIRQLCEGLLPFLLAGGLCRDLQAQLSSEQAITRWRNVEANLKDRVAKLKSSLNKTLFPQGKSTGLSVDIRTNVINRTKELLDDLVTAPKNLPKAPIIHGIAEEDQGRIGSALSRIHEDLPDQLGPLRKRLEKATRRLQEVEDSLGVIPDEDTLRPSLERLQTMHRQSGSAEIAAKQSETELRELDFKLGEVARHRLRTEEKLAELKTSGNRGELVGKVQTVLDDFAAELTQAKVNELRDAVVQCFARLWRKGDIVHRIEFDPSDMRVMLYDRHDRPIPKHRLSAGEKQIYAISLLWALAQVSGRPLPVVIDTPLGRLDRDHRSHLITRYFPHASHQVVILSTDTEIDQAYFRELAPSVSHAYHLHYDQKEACTQIDEGYFWTSDGKEASRAS